jgi:RNA polymerase sigma-70 factor (ECF subfamily)
VTAPRTFATTRWSLILDAANAGSPRQDVALATLCESYWPPVYAFIRRSGKSPDDARDLTQAFFMRVLEKGFFGDADRTRGRFRSFLFSSVRHFLANQHDWAVAHKRGGGAPVLSLEFDDGERRYSLEPADESTPETLYEREWAHAVLASAMTRVEQRYAESGRGELFARLKPYLTGDEPGSYAELAAAGGGTPGQLRVAVHRLRQDYGRALRETIAETVEKPEEVDEELRYLLEALTTATG